MLQANKVIPLAMEAAAAPPRAKSSVLPEPFFSCMTKREKRPLGDLFGLKNFGVSLTRIFPGGESALLHRHSGQDEFVYILEGQATLFTDEGEKLLAPGMCAGFPAAGRAHQLVNRTDRDVLLSQRRSSRRIWRKWAKGIPAQGWHELWNCRQQACSAIDLHRSR
jgi:uncharacterized cupin superfamily protein